MSDRDSAEASGAGLADAQSIHRLALRNVDSVSDPRAWSLSSEERRQHMGRVLSSQLTSGDGNVFGDTHAVKMTNRLRSVGSAADRRAWSLDPQERRSYMVDVIRRSPPQSTTDLQHQELLAQLRENNLPEYVERLLAEKNHQIDELQLSLPRRSAPAGDRTAGRAGAEMLDPSLLSAEEAEQPSPEVLRHVAPPTADSADLSRPDISLAAPDKSQEAPGSEAGGDSRPNTPFSEHSFGSAPTVADGSEAGPRSSRSSIGSRGTSARNSCSGDSLHQLRVALVKKKQLLTERKQQLDQQPTAATPQQTEVLPPPPPAAALLDQHEELETASLASTASEPRQLQLEQIRSRLNVLDPILAQLDADYVATLQRAAQRKISPRSESEAKLLSQVQEMRNTMRQQEEAYGQLQLHRNQLAAQGAPATDPLLCSVEDQLLDVLKDMELTKLDACTKLHEAASLLARAQRLAQQDLDNASTSGYVSMSPRQSVESPHASDCSPRPSPDVAAEGPPRAPSVPSEPAPARPPLPPVPPTSASPYPSTLPWADGSSVREDISVGGDVEMESESEYVSVSQRFHSHPEDDAEAESDNDTDKQSCPSLMDGVSEAVDAEVERLRARIGQLERQLGHRGDAPSPAPDGSARHQLQQERSAWSQERQRLQQCIDWLRSQQGPAAGAEMGQRGEGDLQRRCLRAESQRRALCWQKQYLMVVLGGYQNTETLTLERMTQLTGGAFQPDGRLYLRPLRKFRAAGWAVVAIFRMRFLIKRWRSDRKQGAAGKKAKAAIKAEPSAAAPGDPIAVNVVTAAAAVQPLSGSSSATDISHLGPAEMSTIDRLVRECSSVSTPDLDQALCHLESRSMASVSDVCTEDLEPYLARFDALLERQGLPARR